MASPEGARSVSVVVPVRDDPRIHDCIASVLARRGEVDEVDVVVVDHRSDSRFSCEVLDALPPGVRVLRFDGDTVYAARNAGVDAAIGDVVLFTDADCVVREGWFTEAVAAVQAGADIVQGFSGSVGYSRAELLIQRRYEAHLRGLPAGAPTECDTRNLAVRRRLFDAVRFPGDWRRTGDTYFGLVAEEAGFRVAYRPRMRVDHAHEPDLPLFVAKQLCHGWGAQRLMRERPGLRWHGGHLALVARLSRWTVRLPGQHLFATALGKATIATAGLLQRALPWLPLPVAGLLLGGLDKSAALAGHLLFEGRQAEPRPSDLLRRAGIRD
ncbi:MAG TPA: glycosyltransferase [Tepidiformaceae bacterium]|nr:glycosyltransferase [Tepidiformaceae bacterium]